MKRLCMILALVLAAPWMASTAYAEREVILINPPVGGDPINWGTEAPKINSNFQKTWARILDLQTYKQDKLIAGTDYITPFAAAAAYQAKLGYTAENVANRGVTYPSLINGKVPVDQLPAMPTDYVLPAATSEVLGGVKEGPRISIAPDGTISAEIQSGSVPTPTALGQILVSEAVGEGFGFGVAEPTSIIGGGDADLTAPGPIGTTTPDAGTFTVLTATAIDSGSPALGETGEVSLSEDPANGTDRITLKAPAAITGDLIFTLPSADGVAGQGLGTWGNGQLAFMSFLLPVNNLSDVSSVSQARMNLGLGNVLPVTAPATATDACAAGQWAFDAGFLYLCPSANTWVRAAVSTW